MNTVESATNIKEATKMTNAQIKVMVEAMDLLDVCVSLINDYGFDKVEVCVDYRLGNDSGLRAQLIQAASNS